MGLKVLSLCDGISCGRIALDKIGIEVDEYYAAEIKPIAIKVLKVIIQILYILVMLTRLVLKTEYYIRKINNMMLVNSIW